MCVYIHIYIVARWLESVEGNVGQHWVGMGGEGGGGGKYGSACSAYVFVHRGTNQAMPAALHEKR